MSHISPFTTLGYKTGALQTTLLRANLPSGITGKIGLTVPGGHGNYAQGVFAASSYAANAGAVNPGATGGTVWAYEFNLGGSSTPVDIMPPVIVMNFEIIAG